MLASIAKFGVETLFFPFIKIAECGIYLLRDPKSLEEKELSKYEESQKKSTKQLLKQFVIF